MAASGLILDIHADFELAPHMVVFSHGFGTDRTDRGLFTDIIQALPEGYGYVMFDYYQVTDNTITITSFKDQERNLLSIIAWLSEQKSVEDISLVAHSMGCAVVAMAQPPELHKVVILAPPLSFLHRLRHSLVERPGATLIDGIWSIPRRDNTQTIVADEIISEISGLEAEPLMLDYAAVQPYELLISAHDDVLGAVDYNSLALDPNVTAMTVDGSDHNFTGDSRERTIEAVIDWLT